MKILSKAAVSIALPMLSLFAFSLLGCEELLSLLYEENSAPTVTILEGDRLVDNGETFTLTARASDPDDDTLTYTWYVDSEIQSGETNSSFTTSFSPPQLRAYAVAVEVWDGELSATAEVTVTVAAPVNLPENQAPTVEIQQVDQTITAGHVLDLTCVAADPDDDELVIQWFVDTEVQPGENGAIYQFSRNPLVDTIYEITVSVFDGALSATDTISITVTAVAPTPPPEVAGEWYYYLDGAYYRLHLETALWSVYSDGGLLLENGSFIAFDNGADYFVVTTDNTDTLYVKYEYAQQGTDIFLFTVYSPEGNAEDAIASVNVEISITMYRDLTIVPPVLFLNGPETVNIVQGTSFTDPGATAKDYGEEDVFVPASDSGGLDTAVPGNYTITYSHSDTHGNAADEVMRTVVVNADTNPPVITLTGEATVYLEVHGTYAEPGYSAVDDEEGDLTDAVTVTGAVDTSVTDSYILSYDVSDSKGNAAVTVSRTVIVQDTTAPVITLIGDAEVVLELGGDFTDPGATVTDNYDATRTITGTGTVDTGTPGTYPLTYNAADEAGNPAASVVRTVEVVAPEACEISTLYVFEPDYNQDWILFEIEGTGWTVTDSPGGVPFDSGTVVEFDNSTNVLIVQDDSSGDFGKFTWTEPDGSGHTTMTQFFSYQTIEEARAATENGIDLDGYTIETNVPPVLILNGDDTVAIAVDGTFTDEGASVKDWDDWEPEDVPGDVSGLDTSTNGTYTVTYSFADSDGNEAAQITRTVVVGSGIANIIIQ